MCADITALANKMEYFEGLKLLPVWLSPQHLVATAKILLKGHRLKAMGVVDEGQWIGMVTLENLERFSDQATVREALLVPTFVIDQRLSPRQIAELFIQHDIEYAPVVIRGEYLGLVTTTMLLQELQRSWDPLTELSWSDRLRDWGISNLRSGREVTIIFIDLDDFGRYNKQYGHIVGDHVLQHISSMLKQTIDPERDLLVRYAGDEFTIGTIRTGEEARELAELVEKEFGTVRMPEIDEPVTFSVGVFGGQRTKERENVHYAATLDNLINLASKDCERTKRNRGRAPQAFTAPKFSVQRIVTDAGLTQVVLAKEGTVFAGVSTKKSSVRAVADATARALERAYTGYDYEVGEVLLDEQNGERIVKVSGQVATPSGIQTVQSVSTLVGGDLDLTVANVTLEAFLSGIS